MSCTSGSAASGRLFRNAIWPVGSSVAGPSPLQIGARQRRHDAVEPHRPMERTGLFAPIGDACRNMVLQILADAGQRRFHVMPWARELVRIADARQHQKLRRVDDAAAEDHFSFRMRGDGFAATDIFDAGGAAAVEHDLRRQRVDLDGEVVAPKRRPQIGVGRAAAAAVLHRHLPDAKTFLLRAVIIGRRLVAGGASGGGEGIDQRIGKAGHLRRQRTVAAAIKARAAFPGFLAPEIGQHMGVGPAGQVRTPAQRS